MPKPITDYTYPEIREIVLQAIIERKLEPGYYYSEDRSCWLKIANNGGIFYVEYYHSFIKNTFAYLPEEWRIAA